jgi:cell division protein ZapA (FtsZ GTPase activity inhibitor)
VCRLVVAFVASLVLQGAAAGAEPADAGDTEAPPPPASAGTPAKKEEKPKFSDAARLLGNRVAVAAGLTPEQREPLLPILKQFDAEMAELERKHPKPGATATAREKQAHLVVVDRGYVRIEDTFYARVEEKVLTPEQLPAWQEFRIYFAAVFPLNSVAVTREQGDQIKAMASEVIEQMKPADAKDQQDLYAKRLARLKQRARDEALTEEQRTKLAQLDANREMFLREADLAKELPF